MRLLDVNKILEKTGPLSFCGPAIFEHNSAINIPNSRGKTVTLEVIEEKSKESYLKTAVRGLEMGVVNGSINGIIKFNNNAFKNIDYIDITQAIVNGYSLDNYNNNLKGMDLSANQLTSLPVSNGILERPNWSTLFFDEFNLIITPIGGIIADNYNNYQILYINGVKKEHLKLASFFKGLIGVTVFVNSKFQSIFNRVFKKFEGRLFYSKEIIDFTGCISTFTPNITPSNYKEVIDEFTNAIIEKYMSGLPAKTLETYSKLGIKDYILDFGEETEEAPTLQPVEAPIAPSAPVVEEMISLQDFLSNAGIVEGIENVEETIDSDILSYITTLNLDESEQPVEPPRAPRTSSNG